MADAEVIDPAADAAPDVNNEAIDPAVAAIESRARRMGWRPKDEFRGDPNRWTDATTFVDRGENELPVLRERYRALDDRFAKLETTTGETAKEMTARLKAMSSTFDEFREFSKRGEERAYARAKAELEARMAAAVQTADTAQFTVAKNELDALDRSRAALPPPAEKRNDPPPPVTVVPPQLHPDAQAWIGDNHWFNRDPVMTNYAVALHTQLMQDRPGLSMKENLAEVKADIMSRFPEKFDNPRRSGAPAVAGSPNATPVKKSKGKYPDFADWPSDAKVAYTKFKAQMPKYTTEEYASIYFAEGDK